MSAPALINLVNFSSSFVAIAVNSSLSIRYLRDLDRFAVYLRLRLFRFLCVPDLRLRDLDRLALERLVERLVDRLRDLARLGRERLRDECLVRERLRDLRTLLLWCLVRDFFIIFLF